MHHANYEDGIASYLVDNAIRESVGWASPGSCRKQRPWIWILDDALNRSSHFGSELIAEPRSLRLIIARGF